MPTDVLTYSDAICNAATLGEILGQTDRHIRQLVKDGVLKCTRTKLHGAHFRLADSVQRFVRYRCSLVAQEAESHSSKFEKARTRRMATLAAIETLRLKQLRGEVLSREKATATTC